MNEIFQYFADVLLVVMLVAMIVAIPCTRQKLREPMNSQVLFLKIRPVARREHPALPQAKHQQNIEKFCSFVDFLSCTLTKNVASRLVQLSLFIFMLFLKPYSVCFG